jgi:S-disulfanyl-L-cysteine oxidoreductase SoxD
MTRLRLLAAGVPALFIALAGLAFGQTPLSVRDGVYSEQQAERGLAIYNAKCFACHGFDLQGQGTTWPAIGGRAFTGKWQGKTLGDVFAYLQSEMPYDAPGALEAKAYADVIAYLLAFSRYPAGPRELQPERSVLQAIRVEALP